MSEGVSGIVTHEPRSRLSRLFSHHAGIVRKDFKPFIGGNTNSLEDYQNEVSVLEVLDQHRRDLPFSVPQIVGHGIYPGTGLFEPVAYIKMTALRSPLSEVDDMQITGNQWISHAKRMGTVVAAFHKLNLSETEKGRISNDPYAFILRRIRNHPETQYNQKLVSDICGRLKDLDGPLVFVHGDLGKQNLFASKIGAEITGVCDFCFSGIGPKEIDFMGWSHDGPHKEAFMKAYLNAGGEQPNKKNMVILKSLMELENKLNCDQSLKAYDQQGGIYTANSGGDLIEDNPAAVFDVPPQRIDGEDQCCAPCCGGHHRDPFEKPPGSVSSGKFAFDPQRFNR